MKQRNPLKRLKQPIALSLLIISTSTAVYAQDQVEEYTLTSVYLTWLANDELTISAGAESLFNEDYTDHLTGFNRVIGSECRWAAAC